MCAEAICISGRKSNMPRAWIDIGTSGTLSPEAGRGFQRVRSLFMAKGRDLFVMSVGEGDHQMNSRHYGCPIAFSDAWDQRIDANVSVAELKKAVGKGFDVVENKGQNIVHIEYDPK